MVFSGYRVRGKNYLAVHILYEPNEGSYAARNKGVLNSKGHTAFTDSDYTRSRLAREGIIVLVNKTNVDLSPVKSFFLREMKNT
jgi:hypothetical protein